MSNTLLLAVLGIITTVLLSTGAITFFVRYGIRLALVEATLRQNDLPNLVAKLIVLDNGFAQMRGDMSEVKKVLNMAKLEAMHAKVDLIADMVVKGQGRSPDSHT